MKIKLNINKLYCQIVQRYPQKRNIGQFPRRNWIPGSKAIKPNKIRHKVIKIKDSPHYKYLKGKKSFYKNYMNKAGWLAGYGLEHSLTNFDKLIREYSALKKEGKSFENLIKVRRQNRKFIIEDGLHRGAIFLNDNSKKKILVEYLFFFKFKSFLKSFLRLIFFKLKTLKSIFLNFRFYYYYFKVKNEFLNFKKKQIKKNFFLILIWPNGMKYKKKIKNIIKKSYKIYNVKDFRIHNIFEFVNYIYCADTAPRDHIVGKTKYYINKCKFKKTSFVIFEINKPTFYYLGDGKYKHITCNQIRDLKSNLRKKFNSKIKHNKTDIHVIHASDSILETNFLIHKFKLLKK